MATGWGIRNLARHPLRTALSLVGIAVASAMLLDMVMLSGGIERSFEQLLLGRGYQIRMTPKGTLPFDAEATITNATAVLEHLRAESAIAAAGGVLGTTLYARRADTLVTLFGYGIDPRAQALYQVEAGSDLAADDSAGVLVSRAAAAAASVALGDTLRLVGRLDPQVAAAARERALVVRGVVRWLYDYRGQRSIGTTLRTMQALSGQDGADAVSVVVVKVKDGLDVAAAADTLRAHFSTLETNSVADLVVYFRQRLVYFRQLSLILGTVSLVVTVLLVATLLTITVNERLGEIATLRAIGVSRGRVIRQVLVEGAALTVLGAAAGIALGLVTAQYLDAILTSFPGLPAAFSFFVPRARAIAQAAAVLLATGCLAGLYPAWLAARAPIAATLRAEAT
ncbi:MAG: FtsX-like permease family protein [Gemmatimonadota bacterium]